MNSRVTFGLLAAALAAVGYLVWFDRDRPGTQAAAVADRKALPVGRNPGGKVTPINRIEITGSNGKIVLAMDGARGWHVLAPTVDRANPVTMRELVEALDTSLKFDSLPATPDDLERFGLRHPEFTLKVFRGDEPPVELQLGARTAVDGRAYARIAGASDVIVIPDSIESFARRPVDEYRDLRLLNLRPAEIIRVTIKNNWGEFELQRDRGRWELTRPVPARADDKAVNEWLERLCASEVQVFAPGGAADLLTYGLMSPRGSVRLELESESGEAMQPIEILLGQRADARYVQDSTYVRVPGRGLVAAVPLVIEEALLLEPDALREHTLFSLNPDLVDRIHIQPASGDELVLARQGENWTMMRPVPMAVEASEVTRLMKILPNARVRDFLTGAASEAAKMELEPPALRVTFASFSSENTAESAAGESPIATLSFSRARPDESVLVRVEEDNVIARLDADNVAKVATDPIAWQPLAMFESPPSVNSLTIQEANQTRSFARDGKSWKRVGEESALAPVAVESAAALLAGLRAVRWIGPVQSAHGLDTPTLIVRANPGSATGAIELKIGRQTAEGMWPATLSGRKGVFLLSGPDRQTLAEPAH
jgi:Domain of unknown function (DUF4340)